MGVVSVRAVTIEDRPGLAASAPRDRRHRRRGRQQSGRGRGSVVGSVLGAVAGGVAIAVMRKARSPIKADLEITRSNWTMANCAPSQEAV